MSPVLKNISFIFIFLFVSSSVISQNNNINLSNDVVDEESVMQAKQNLHAALNNSNVPDFTLNVQRFTNFLSNYNEPYIQFHLGFRGQPVLYLRPNPDTYLDISKGLQGENKNVALHNKHAMRDALNGEDKAVLADVNELTDILQRCAGNNIPNISFIIGLESQTDPVLYIKVPRKGFEDVGRNKTSNNASSFSFASYNEATDYLYLKAGRLCPPPSSCQ